MKHRGPYRFFEPFPVKKRAVEIPNNPVLHRARRFVRDLCAMAGVDAVGSRPIEPTRQPSSDPIEIIENSFAEASSRVIVRFHSGDHSQLLELYCNPQKFTKLYSFILDYSEYLRVSDNPPANQG